MGRPTKEGRHIDRSKSGAPGRRYNTNTGHGGIAVEIDVVALAAAAETHASYEVLGLIFGVGETTLSNNPTYKAIIEKARATAKKNLLASQFRNAISNDNATMQIWLGKNYLDQKDVSRVEQTGPDGRPIESVVTKRVTAVIPDNGRDATGA